MTRRIDRRQIDVVNHQQVDDSAIGTRVDIGRWLPTGVGAWSYQSALVHVAERVAGSGGVDLATIWPTRHRAAA